MFRNETMEAITITGVLKKIRVQKPESGWGVYTVQANREDGTHTSICATGTLPEAVEGQTYTFSGSFVVHPTYGEQFKFIRAKASKKPSADGAYALLSSNRFHGVGPKRARAIVDHFGKDTLKVIKDDPMRLTEIPGIGEKQAMAIHAAMPDIGVWEKLRMLLKDATDAAVSKIYAKYKDDSVKIVKANPYILIQDLDGYGFHKADAIAGQVGITGAHPLRVQAAIYHCLTQAAEMEGHCFSYASNLQVRIQDLIPQVDIETIADAIKAMTDPSYRSMQLHVDPDGAIYLQRLWVAEMNVSNIVREMIERPQTAMYTARMVDSAALEIAAETGIELEQTQKDAVLQALNTPLCVVTGGPGTGKTTIIKTMLRVIENYSVRPMSVSLMAPTGRASRRMVEATGHEAATIHASLCLGKTDEYSKPYFSRRRPYQADYIIVDESSMIDISLASSMLMSIDPQTTRLILIGDADQLPPVGPGIFFLELIKSYRVPTVRLKFSYRQSGSIAQNANKVNNGGEVHGFIRDDDFHFISANKDTAPEKAVNEYLQMVKKYGIDDVVMLSPKKKGNCGTISLNLTIQDILNPQPAGAGIQAGDYVLKPNDRVMLTKNNIVKGHANGDVGSIKSFDERGAVVEFDNHTSAVVTLQELRTSFILAYVITIHKSQGSEYSGVVMLFTTEHVFMGERALIYTGMTRAKKEISMLGDSRTINRAIGVVKPVTRNSKLCDRINA